MSRFHTHYENLKVARNAPPEVIKAAYRVLAQRYHPDVNPSPDAARVMKVINEAWAVLGDPIAKQRHDEWIEDQLIAEALEEASAPTNAARTGASYTSPPASASSSRPSTRASENQPNRLVQFNSWLGTPRGTKLALCYIVGAAILAWLWLTNDPTTARKPSPRLERPQLSANSTAEPTLREVPPPTQLDPVPLVVQPTSGRWSPNGKPWPKGASYLVGMPRRASGGLSKLTVDNTDGGSDVHIKLCTFGVERCTGLRNVFVPQGSSFTMTSIAPGTFDLRYRDLSSGRIAKSEEIRLRQVEEENGTRFSVFTITLYRVRGGNTKFTAVPEEQF